MISSHDSIRQEQMHQGERPKFNVEESFLGVTIIQMNAPMRDLLAQFIGEVEDSEREIVALGKALQDPQRSRELRARKRERYHQSIEK